MTMIRIRNKEKGKMAITKSERLAGSFNTTLSPITFMLAFGGQDDMIRFCTIVVVPTRHGLDRYMWHHQRWSAQHGCQAQDGLGIEGLYHLLSLLCLPKSAAVSLCGHFIVDRTIRTADPHNPLLLPLWNRARVRNTLLSLEDTDKSTNKQTRTLPFSSRLVCSFLLSRTTQDQGQQTRTKTNSCLNVW